MYYNIRTFRKKHPYLTRKHIQGNERWQKGLLCEGYPSELITKQMRISIALSKQLGWSVLQDVSGPMKKNP